MSSASTVPIDAANAEQLRAWDGDEGAYWAAHAPYFERSMLPFRHRLIAAAAIASSEHVLDIGCGTGASTLDAARAAAAGTALGVDLSRPMLAYARRAADAERLTNACFVQADAQVHPFARRFDVAISNAGAMFFGDPVAAFANIGGALVPGGRLLLLTWQSVARNEWIRELTGALAAGRERPEPPLDAPGPFSLADPERVRTILTSAGFAEVDLESVDEQTWFGTDADDTVRFVLGLLRWMLDGLDDDAQARALAALHATAAAHETSDGVRFDGSAWLVRAIRP